MNGSLHSPVYLSQTTFLPEPKIGLLNFIEAPMGSGKNTWASNIGVSIKLMLVSTNGLLAEAIEDGWTEIRKEQFVHQWENWAFGDNIPTNTKYVTTVQHFSRHLPNLANCRRLEVIYVDECDLVMLHMRRWAGNNIEQGDNLLKWLAEACKTKLCFAMSATGVDNTMQFVSNILPVQLCVSTLPLRHYSRNECIYLSPYLRTMWLAKNRRPVLIYCKLPRTVFILKKRLTAQGLRVLGIVADGAKGFIMDAFDREGKRRIVEDKCFPDCDVLIINNAANRGLNIKDGICKDVVIVDGEWDETVQAHGRLRSDGVNVWRIASSEWVENNMEEAKLLAREELEEGSIRTGQEWKDLLGMHSYKVGEMVERMKKFGIDMILEKRKYRVAFLKEAKPPQTKNTELNKFSYEKNTPYTLEELYNIFQVSNVAKLNELILNEKNLLKQVRVRKDGKTIQRYKII